MGQINEKLKSYIRNWLNVREAMNDHSIIIDKAYNDRTRAFEYTLWYNGNADELHQFYTSTSDYTGNTSFWKAPVNVKVPFRKIHTGLPSRIVDKLVDIVMDDMNQIEFSEAAMTANWQDIQDKIDFVEVVKEGVAKTLVTGEGAFKISVDPELSDYPIIEFYGGDDLVIEQRRGKIYGIRFYSTHMIDKKVYRLEEYYIKGAIINTLYDETGNDVTNPLIEDVFGMNALVETPGYMACVPLIINPDKRNKAKGRSIFEGKVQAFDSLDEIWSTWMDEIRSGRTKTYIPDILVPRDPLTGMILKPDAFTNRFIKVENNIKENADNKIDQQGEMRNISNLSMSFISALDLCLQGVISPSTLGIDVKKMDNAESQREKEKTTLYTRTRIIRVLEKTLPKLVDVILKTHDLTSGINPGTYLPTVSFGEYATPSFDAMIATVSQAYSGGVMSLEKAIDELYGDSLSPSEKDEEIKRIKNSEAVNEPSIVTEDLYA